MRNLLTDVPGILVGNAEDARAATGVTVAVFEHSVVASVATLGGAPPDMSLLAKAREGGPAYIYSLVTGYQNAPAGVTVAPGKYYNPYFPNNLISMPPPLRDDAVTYDDGVKATTDQEARDVAAFLAWAAEPHQEERKQMGFSVVRRMDTLSSRRICWVKSVEPMGVSTT